MNSNKELIKKMVDIELARRGKFYNYCKLMVPTFYTKERTYLKDLCNTLEEFLFSDNKNEKLIINMPPQSGKSLTMTMFETYAFSFNKNERIIKISYSDDLSVTLGKKTRDLIGEEKMSDKIVFNDIFPDIKVKRGSSSSKKWQIDGAPQTSMLSTSPTGALTGFGSTICIVDDLIKNAEIALNDNNMEKQWEWYTSTLESRILGKLIVVFTRWRTNDLCGKLIEYYNNNNIDYKLYTIKAEIDENKSFCDEYLTDKQLLEKKNITNEAIWQANYNQSPFDIKGRLYNNFKTYNKEELLANGLNVFDNIVCYVDTADTGADWLCAIAFGIYKNYIYVLDILYTKAKMEITEPLLADMLNKWKVSVCRIESNNGGRGFARNISSILNQNKNFKCQITSFFQSNPKQSRIISNSTNVMNLVHFEEGWFFKYPEFFKDIFNYQVETKNKHDDAPDTLTGVFETFELMGY